MPIKSIASGGGTPPERAPPPCKRSGLSGGPASSPNVVPAFTLPPGSPLSIAPALPLKQEAPSPIGAPRAAPTSIPSRCAHRTLSPKRLPAQRSAGVPRAGLPRGARLPGPSAPAAGWAGPMHGPRWPLRNPNDGTRPPPRRWRKAARCAVALGATRELPVRRRGSARTLASVRRRSPPPRRRFRA